MDTMTVMAPDPKILDELVRRIRDCVQPERILLFGSGARNEWLDTSDLDVLVVMPDASPRRETARRIYPHLIGLGHPVDLVVVTESDVRRFAGSPATVIGPALPRDACYMPPDVPGPDHPEAWLFRARSDLALARTRVEGEWQSAVSMAGDVLAWANRMVKAR